MGNPDKGGFNPDASENKEIELTEVEKQRLEELTNDPDIIAIEELRNKLGYKLEDFKLLKANVKKDPHSIPPVSMEKYRLKRYRELHGGGLQGSRLRLDKLSHDPDIVKIENLQDKPGVKEKLEEFDALKAKTLKD